MAARRRTLGVCLALLALLSVAAVQGRGGVAPPPYEPADPLAGVTDDVIVEALGELTPTTGRGRLAFLQQVREQARKTESVWDDYGPSESRKIPLKTRLLMIKAAFLQERNEDLEQVVAMVQRELPRDDDSVAAQELLLDLAEQCARGGSRWRAIELLARAGRLGEKRLRELGSQRRLTVALDIATAKWEAEPASREGLNAYWNAEGRLRLREALVEMQPAIARTTGELAAELEKWKAE